MTSVGCIRLVFIREFRLFSIDWELIDTFVQKVVEVTLFICLMLRENDEDSILILFFNYHEIITNGYVFIEFLFSLITFMDFLGAILIIIF